MVLDPGYQLSDIRWQVQLRVPREGTGDDRVRRCTRGSDKLWLGWRGCCVNESSAWLSAGADDACPSPDVGCRRGPSAACGVRRGRTPPGLIGRTGPRSATVRPSTVKRHSKCRTTTDVGDSRKSYS